MPEQENRATILVVDDQPINVQLLQRILVRQRLRVVTAYNGEQALQIANTEKPDLILLDIMMPEMDGMEVCRRLKDDPETREIPVIFITARTSREGKLEGLGSGAADYIVKPIDIEETVARVNTQLRIRESFRKNLELSQRLSEARRVATVAHITEGIAHNLNNLLGIVVGYLDLLKSSPGDPERLQRACSKMETAINRMVKIVSDLTNVAQFDRPRREPIAVRQLFEEATARFQEETGLAPAFVIDGQGLDSQLETNTEMMEMVLGRLFSNAWESYDGLDRPARAITVTARPIEQRGQKFLEIAVIDGGSGLAPEVRDNAFEAFVSTKAAVGRGMGLTIARHSVRSLGGDVRLEDAPGGGTRAVITHPLADPQDLK